jgi:hypothetical protein
LFEWLQKDKRDDDDDDNHNDDKEDERCRTPDRFRRVDGRVDTNVGHGAGYLI